MYICLDCRKIFDEPEIEYGEQLEYFGVPCREETLVCPNCKGVIKETLKCDYCGEYIEGDYIKLPDGQIVCDECYTVKNILD
ncbi:hypothetical protein [Anaerovorax sp. IOR16]|uniref:hypothetical protein n=1 Tax=Anaerovorax sp. IOR16 TaxID=2773458 RepID=UPI0019D007C2|nr:hypothetical protein [Anaerovorax sp. IOR16]